MTTLTRAAQTARDEASAQLLARLLPGDTVNVIQRHVSASGMTRWLSLFVGDENITHAAAAVLGENVTWKNGHATVKVTGCGMDMHFATVYNLGRHLWPNGHACNGETGPVWDGGCPSNDHSNDRVSDYRTDRIHRDGGYSLNARTL